MYARFDSCRDWEGPVTAIEFKNGIKCGMSFADTVFYLHNNSVFISCPLEPNEMMVPSSKSDLSGCLT